MTSRMTIGLEGPGGPPELDGGDDPPPGPGLAVAPAEETGEEGDGEEEERPPVGTVAAPVTLNFSSGEITIASPLV